MKRKVILVLIDGLAWQVARDSMGYLLALVEAGQATAYALRSALPSLSRPLYECILTGTAPVDSGIVHNGVSRLSNQQSIFHLVQNAGLTSAAAAYHWVSELYNRSPYLARRDRHTDDEGLPIQHGMFYHQDDYPDAHLLLDAEALRRRHDPDFLLIHPMNVDDAGHRHGLDSPDYRNAARRFDALLSEYLPDWIAEGYQILVSSDHGMNNDCTHGGNLPQEREVPLFVIGDGFSHRPGLEIAQTALCGSMATLMGIAHDKSICTELLGADYRD